MKLSKRIRFAVLGTCMALSLTAIAVACNNTPEPTDYAVTYAFGSCGDTEYAGESTLPVETNKEEGETFDLASALEWEGYTFMGWNDGETTYDAGVEYTMPGHAVTLTAQWELTPTYAVTYAFGRCNGVDYAGTSTLPTEDEQEGNAKFKLASAPVWEGYTFDGWSDGKNTYAADAEYTMSGKAVTLTAQWTGYVELINYDIPAWNEGATTGGYTIEKGQHITISAVIYKETSDSRFGINAKIFPNGAINSNGSFYQFRCDFAVKRANWEDWNENNNGFKVDNGGFNRETYRESDEGITEITVALSEEGVLTYTFVYQATSVGDVIEGGYSHRRVFTDTNKMNSAYVIFGYEHASSQPSGTRPRIIYPASDALTVTIDMDCEDSEWSTIYGDSIRRYLVSKASTFTITDAPLGRTGYDFLGWQINGEGSYYKQNDTISIDSDSVRLIAAWRQAPIITVDRNGAERNPTFVRPTATYHEETGKYTVSGLPGINEFSYTKSGYVFDGWDVTVDGEPVEVNGPFAVDPGATVVFTVRWAETYYVTYAYGSYEGTNYGGWSAKPTQARTAEGRTFTVAAAIKWNGYTFLGWNDGEKTYQPGETYTMPGHSVTLTAQWEPATQTSSVADESNAVALAAALDAEITNGWISLVKED